MDRIYTPAVLAKALVDSCSITKPRFVADFAAGDGALLLAARARWPEAILFGSDVNATAISQLKEALIDCSVDKCDFLAGIRSPMRNGQVLRDECDVILLNPPFTCRGRSRHFVTVFDREFSASRALAFTARALPYLSDKGEILALLPASVLDSERDQTLLDVLRDQYRVTQVGPLQKSAFEGHAISVAVVKLWKRPRPFKGTRSIKSPLRSIDYKASVGCGRLPVHVARPAKNGLRFVHTTDLQEGKIMKGGRTVSANNVTISGPAVLMSRVGLPAKSKIAYMPRGTIVPSDCVIVIQTEPRGHEATLASLLRENWTKLKATFGGSCAPYTTLNRVVMLLSSLGVAAVKVRLRVKESSSGPTGKSSNRRRPERPAERHLVDTLTL